MDRPALVARIRLRRCATASRVHLFHAKVNTTAAAWIHNQRLHPSRSNNKHLPFASATLVQDIEDGESIVCDIELHQDDERHPIYCRSHRSDGLSEKVKIADAAKGSPYQEYRVPTRWIVPIDHFRYSYLVSHLNWQECYACWHNGSKLQAQKGRTIDCTVCPRSFHHSSDHPCSGLTKHSRTKNWTCDYCLRYEQEAVVAADIGTDTKPNPNHKTEDMYMNDDQDEDQRLCHNRHDACESDSMSSTVDISDPINIDDTVLSNSSSILSPNQQSACSTVSVQEDHSVQASVPLPKLMHCSNACTTAPATIDPLSLQVRGTKRKWPDSSLPSCKNIKRMHLEQEAAIQTIPVNTKSTYPTHTPTAPIVPTTTTTTPPAVATTPLSCIDNLRSPQTFSSLDSSTLPLQTEQERQVMTSNSSDTVEVNQASKESHDKDHHRHHHHHDQQQEEEEEEDWMTYSNVSIQKEDAFDLLRLRYSDRDIVQYVTLIDDHTQTSRRGAHVE